LDQQGTYAAPRAPARLWHRSAVAPVCNRWSDRLKTGPTARRSLSSATTCATVESDQQRDIAKGTREVYRIRRLTKPGQGRKPEAVCRNGVNRDAEGAHLPACTDCFASPCGRNRNHGTRVLRTIALMPTPVIVVVIRVMLAAVTPHTIALMHDKSSQAQRWPGKQRHSNEIGENAPTHSLNSLSCLR
jgi:hypothetical protein